MCFSFHWAIKEVVDAYDILDDLVININQTPLPFILPSKYTIDNMNENVRPIANSGNLSSYRNLLNYAIWYFFSHANILSRPD